LQIGFVGSVKLDEHKDLAQIPNKDDRFQSYPLKRLEGTRGFHVQKEVYGKQRTLVVTYNQNLYDAQWLTVQNDIAKAMGPQRQLYLPISDNYTYPFK